LVITAEMKLIERTMIPRMQLIGSMKITDPKVQMVKHYSKIVIHQRINYVRHRLHLSSVMKIVVASSEL